jgi:hypothetical protein
LIEAAFLNVTAGRGSEEEDKMGFLDENRRAIFGRGYAAAPHILIEQLRKDEAITEADALSLFQINSVLPTMRMSWRQF